MTVGTVVLCPAAPGEPAVDWDDIAESLVDHGVRVVRPNVPALHDEPGGEALRTAHWVAHCAVSLSASSSAAGSGLREPLLLVTVGGAGPMLPALGFAQRAARRTVGGYVLVDAALPQHGSAPDWPDAPVTVLLTAAASDAARSAALQARLRGWDTRPTPDLATELATIALQP
ncbi:MAG: hypothetical protein EPO13_04640 [Actinomycetota bacterium]|nr:MAG: hypothetical protein EPO13_04640 [Actinomycetota bacterium]